MLSWSQMVLWIMGAVLVVSAALVAIAETEAKGDTLGECVHTYREPGCEGGRECGRREGVPCELPEPS